MILVDANLLIYAVNRDAIHHEASLKWLDETLCSTDHDFKRFPGVHHMNPLEPDDMRHSPL